MHGSRLTVEAAHSPLIWATVAAEAAMLEITHWERRWIWVMMMWHHASVLLIEQNHKIVCVCLCVCCVIRWCSGLGDTDLYFSWESAEHFSTGAYVVSMDWPFLAVIMAECAGRSSQETLTRCITLCLPSPKEGIQHAQEPHSAGQGFTFISTQRVGCLGF